jgi:hypothetical protein
MKKTLYPHHLKSFAVFCSPIPICRLNISVTLKLDILALKASLHETFEV